MQQGARRPTTTGNVVSLDARTKGSRAATYPANTGGPTDGGDTWRDSVETRFTELRTDVRHLLIGGAIVALALLGAGWGVYTSAMGQMREIAVQQQTLSGKIDTMDAKVMGKFETLGERIDKREVVKAK